MNQREFMKIKFKIFKIPAEINEKIFNQSKDWAILIAEELKYVGTSAQNFIDRNDNLYVGDCSKSTQFWTSNINAFNVSQFENHVRAVWFRTNSSKKYLMLRCEFTWRSNYTFQKYSKV